EDAPIQRNGKHVARFDLIGSLVDLVAVDPHTTRLSQLGGEGTRFNHSRKEQPFVYSLASFLGHARSFSYLRSWSFNAASIAKGELGSIFAGRSSRAGRRWSFFRVSGFLERALFLSPCAWRGLPLPRFLSAPSFLSRWRGGWRRSKRPWRQRRIGFGASSGETSAAGSSDLASLVLAEADASGVTVSTGLIDSSSIAGRSGSTSAVGASEAAASSCGTV